MRDGEAIQLANSKIDEIRGAFPEWLDRLAQRAERIRFMRKEEKRLAQHREP